MKIAVIGGGSIGLLVAAHWGENHDVTVFTRTIGQARKLRSNGVVIQEGTSRRVIKIKSACFEEKGERLHLSMYDCVFVTVKQYHLPDLLPTLHTCETCLVFLQNGMTHLDYIANLQASTIYVGIVLHGAVRLDEITTNHTGRGSIKLGLFKGERVSTVEGIDSTSFPVEIVDDFKSIMNEKLIINSVINPLTAVLNVKNGQLMTNPSFKKLAFELVFEVCKALSVSEEDSHYYIKRVEETCLATAFNSSSMLVDLHLGRGTELDAILGYVIKEANKQKVQVHMTVFLYEMIKGLEEECGGG